MAEQANCEPTVFVVDDDPEFRESLSLLLESVDVRTETFASAEAFLQSYRSARPGCLVLDVRMPGMSGLELHRTLLKQGRRIPTLILTAYAEVDLAVEAMKAGVMDFLEKPYSSQALLDQVQRAFAQDEQNRAKQAECDDIRCRFESLSPREYEVVEQLAAGRNTKEIADELGVTTVTVDFHRRNALRKLHIKTAAQLGRLFEAHDRLQSSAADS